jgi:hypothetical protein
MARAFLKHIRVQSVKELKDRIVLGVQEIKEASFAHLVVCQELLKRKGGDKVQNDVNKPD